MPFAPPVTLKFWLQSWLQWQGCSLYIKRTSRSLFWSAIIIFTKFVKFLLIYGSTHQQELCSSLLQWFYIKSCSLDSQCTSKANCSDVPTCLTLLCLPEQPWVHNQYFFWRKLFRHGTRLELTAPKSVVHECQDNHFPPQTLPYCSVLLGQVAISKSPAHF